MIEQSRSMTVAGALAIALLAAGCDSGNGHLVVADAGPNGDRAELVSVGTLPISGPCAATCAAGDDGMEYRVTSTRRFTGPSGISVVAVGFTMINASDAGHDFDATGGGFSAVLTSGGVVQLQNELSATAAGDPSCYTNPVVYGGGTDPNLVHVGPHTTFAFPKQVCMNVARTDRVTEIEFADQDASGNATVVLPTPI